MMAITFICISPLEASPFPSRLTGRKERLGESVGHGRESVRFGRGVFSSTAAALAAWRVFIFGREHQDNQADDKGAGQFE